MANFIIKGTTIQKFFTKKQVWVIRILSKPDKILCPIWIRFRQVTLYIDSGWWEKCTLTFWGQGVKVKVITYKVTVIVTDSWRGPSDFVSVLVHFVFCRFWCAPGRLTGPIQMKSSRTFIPGNRCIERMIILKKKVIFTILFKLCRFYFCIVEISEKNASFVMCKSRAALCAFWRGEN